MLVDYSFRFFMAYVSDWRKADFPEIMTLFSQL